MSAYHLLFLHVPVVSAFRCLNKEWHEHEIVIRRKMFLNMAVSVRVRGKFNVLMKTGFCNDDAIS